MSIPYNTGNPIGSTDPRDLIDNAHNFDNAMNSTDPTFTDRLGVQRDTWAGQEDQFDLAQSGRASAFDAAQAAREDEFDDFLVASGFVSLGNYAPGLNFTAYNQYMAYGGFFYRPAPSTLPFTTSGTWGGADEDLFVLLSADDALRQDLADDTDDAKGASLVGWRSSTVGALLDGLVLTELDPSGATSIDAALQAALTANDVVVLPAGDFKLSSKMTLKTGQVLRGQGQGATRIFRDTSVTPFDFFEGISVTDVLVEGIFFDSVAKLPVGTPANRHCALRFWDNNTATRCERIEVRGCRFEKFTSAENQVEGRRGVVAVDQCNQVMIHGNSFHDNRATCVYYRFSKDIQITNNYCLGEQLPYDLDFQPDQGLGSFCSGGGEGQTVSLNRIYETGYSSINVGGTGVSVVGNVIENPTYAGIGVNESDAEPSTGVQIIGNSIRGAKELAGIYIWNVSGFVISGNTVQGCGQQTTAGGIRLQHTSDGAPNKGVISGNLITENYGAGVRVHAGTEIEIVGNRIFANSGAGISCIASSATYSTELTINGNSICDNGSYAIDTPSPASSPVILWVDGNTVVSSNIATLQATGFVMNGSGNVWNLGSNSFSPNYDTSKVETSFASRATKAFLQINSPTVNRMKVVSALNYTNTATYDPASIAAGAGVTTTVTVTGAALGDFAQATFSLDLQGITLSAWVSAANTVSVRFQNGTGSAIDLASGTLTARVIKL